MTYGPIEGIDDLHRCMEIAKEHSAVSAVVLHLGAVANLVPSTELGLVVQTFGLPLTPQAFGTKSQVATVDDALRLAADAIAVELDLNDSHLPAVLHRVASTLSRAATIEVPVLVMATAARASDPVQATAQAVRVSSELGADLIKIGLGDGVLAADNLHVLAKAVAAAPPVLLAGGALSSGLSRRLIVASQLGFAGACIGRQVFQADDPMSMLDKIADAFDRRQSR